MILSDVTKMATSALAYEARKLIQNRSMLSRQDWIRVGEILEEIERRSFAFDKPAPDTSQKQSDFDMSPGHNEKSEINRYEPAQPPRQALIRRQIARRNTQDRVPESGHIGGVVSAVETQTAINKS